MSLKVETIGGHLMVHHYVEDVREMHHVRLLSASDVIGPRRTKYGVVWELSVELLDAEHCDLTNHFIGKTTPEYWESVGKDGIPFEGARRAQYMASSAHNAQDTQEHGEEGARETDRSEEITFG